MNCLDSQPSALLNIITQPVVNTFSPPVLSLPAMVSNASDQSLNMRSASPIRLFTSTTGWVLAAAMASFSFAVAASASMAELLAVSAAPEATSAASLACCAAVPAALDDASAVAAAAFALLAASSAGFASRDTGTRTTFSPCMAGSEFTLSSEVAVSSSSTL